MTPSPEGEGFFKFSGMTYNGLYSSYHYQHYTYRHSERSEEYVFRSFAYALRHIIEKILRVAQNDNYVRKASLHSRRMT